MLEIIFMRATEEAIHIIEGIGRRLDDEGGEGETPIEGIQFCNQGIGEKEIIVDEFAIRATRAIGDTPAHGLERARQDLTSAAAVLQMHFIGVNMITEAAGLDDGEEAPTELGFFGLGEFDRNDTRRESTVEYGPETFAHASGVDDEVLGMPGLGESLDLTKDAEVVFTDPTVAGDDMIGGTLERGEGGKVNLDNSESGGITAGITEIVGG